MKKILFLNLLIAVSSAVYAQKTIEDLGNLSDKKFFKNTYVFTELNRTLVKQLNKGRIEIEELPQIRNVGLLSIYIKDPAFRKGKRGGVIYKNAPNGNQLVAGILDEFLALTNKSLGAFGMQIKTPDQYLNSDDKKSTYKNFFINYSLVPEAKKFGQFFDKNTESYASPEGYRTIYTTVAGDEIEVIVDQVGEITSELGLDAFITIEIGTQTTGKSIILESVTAMLVAPDPSGRSGGILLGSSKYSPTKLLAFASHSNGEINESRLDGFGPIVNRLVTNLGATVIEEIDAIE